MGDIFSHNNLLNVFEEALKGLSLRHKVLANNIANADTPNFKRSDVDFKSILEKIIKENSKSSLSLKTTHPKHIPLLSSSYNTNKFPIIKYTENKYRKDGNNVDIEKEIVEINKNYLLYNSVVELLSKEFSILRYAIEEGGR